MAKKQFKTESKKILDMMINSIYTHKEIFLRELISNASDAIDKLYFRSLTDQDVGLKKEDYEIRITPDTAARTLTISDNGCGMTRDELESNLGTIARSGSLEFKKAQEENSDIDIIGQFGVGFYSAFMVADKITVDSLAYGESTAYRWESEGADGYTVSECKKEGTGTTIILHIKPDTDDEKFSNYLEEYTLRSLVKRYSDYIRYPVRMLVTRSRKTADSTDEKPEYEQYQEDETLNSMIPLWKKPASDVTDDEYANFYRDKFSDYEAPLKVIRQKTEGTSTYEALLFIPSHAPYNYYTRDYEKGLQLYSSGVLIMDKCQDLLPDHFSFIHGLVDSADLSLNISREMLQHDRQLRLIAKSIEKKIASELKKMLESDRDKYEQFFKEFGIQLKYGIYADYGMHKDELKDLIMFKSSFEDKNTTLSEYVSRMKEDQKKIYYATGETAERIKMLPQAEAVSDHGYEILYLTDDVDEFALQVLHAYDEKEFLNICKDELDLTSDDDKKKAENENTACEDMLKFMQESIGNGVHAVRFTSKLKKHPACLSTDGAISMGMEKTLSHMPGADAGMMKADIVLEINMSHPIAEKLKALYDSDKDTLAKYSKILYANARLVSGFFPDDPSELSLLVSDLMAN